LAKKARFATIHLLRFPEITTPEQLTLNQVPVGSISWKIGPGGKVGPDGRRLPSDTWSAVALFSELAEAELAFRNNEEFMPFLSATAESWHLLLRPFKHHGECNHIEREAPGELFEVSQDSGGGPVAVLTTAGYQLGFEANMDRVVAFRHKVDNVGAWMKDLPGCFFSRAFTPHTVGYDGFTVSVWRSDEDMLSASSFTRLRILDSTGQWNGRGPLVQPEIDAD
jgi:hypothetical protein